MFYVLHRGGVHRQVVLFISPRVLASRVLPSSNNFTIPYLIAFREDFRPTGFMLVRLSLASWLSLALLH